jgi:saccharopine dehydrogenase-like NADP-dependent oxidoreductase
MPDSDDPAEFETYLGGADIILDCLPGNLAPRIARLAKKYRLHYANLTEYVQETTDVIQIANTAETGFILQSGLAPGFINVLANGLYQKFSQDNQVEVVDSIAMKVGALTQNAASPHFYGFTWSPVGVATLYVKPAQIIRDFKLIMKASLTERSTIILGGVQYEEDLTSGGAADLPEALVGKTRNLDYKTLRYPGHYHWIDSILRQIPYGEDRVKKLQSAMEQNIPNIENDVVIIYASVSGKDHQGKYRMLEKYYKINPMTVGGKLLRAIQSTTAAGLAECARLLLMNKYSGCILQSQIDPEDYLSGPFISRVYQTAT